VHVIPSCAIPSFCTTDASSHTGNARLEPHIGNAGEIGGRYFNREKSGDVAPTYPGFELATYLNRLLFKKLFSDRPPASDSRGALQSLNVRNRRTRILLTRGVITLLRPPARQPLLLARSNTLTSAHSCLRCNSLFAPAQAGRVALMLLPAHVLHAFCNLLIGR
jgi:hypothetical protein